MFVIIHAAADSQLRAQRTRVLRKAGYSVEEAGSGNETLLLARKTRPDLIVANGLSPDFFRQVRSNPLTAAVPLVHVCAPGVASSECDQYADAALAENTAPSVLVSVIQAVLKARTPPHTLASPFTDLIQEQQRLTWRVKRADLRQQAPDDVQSGPEELRREGRPRFSFSASYHRFSVHVDRRRV